MNIPPLFFVLMSRMTGLRCPDLSRFGLTRWIPVGSMSREKAERDQTDFHRHSISSPCLSIARLEPGFDPSGDTPVSLLTPSLSECQTALPPVGVRAISPVLRLKPPAWGEALRKIELRI